jgi:hypothetical protein
VIRGQGGKGQSNMGVRLALLLLLGVAYQVRFQYGQEKYIKKIKKIVELYLKKLYEY